MLWIGRVVAGVRALFHRARLDEELDAELGDFLAHAVEQKIAAGMSRDAAIRAARLQLGSAAAVKDRVRDVGWEAGVESVWRDVRYALRSMRRAPGFAIAATFTLALAIGATTAVFSLLDAVILKSLPVRHPEELVLVRGSLYPVFQAFRRQTGIFVDLLATSGTTRLDAEIDNGVRETTNVSLVSGSYFSTLGIEAAIGRCFTADDDRAPGEHPVAVASYGYWQRRFGREAAILNHVVRISGTPITIIGVAPPGFFGEHVGMAPDLWVPLTMWGHVVPGRNLLESPATGWLRMIGRVRPGVATSGVQPALTETFRQVVTAIHGPKAPEDVRRDTANATIVFEPAGKGLSTLRAQFARPLQLLMGAVVLVLAIACANIANLLLARAAARRREIDVRLALGLSRTRLLRQLLTESLVLAACGGTVGIAFAWAGKEALLRLISADGSRAPVAVSLEPRLLAFVAAISLATAILFGLAPAWQSARAALVSSLRARDEAVGGRQRLRSVLVVAQVAVSLVLVMGAGLFVRTIANLRDVDLGFAQQQLITLDIRPQSAGYRDEAAIALSRRLLDRLVAVPAVASVSLSEHGVLTGSDSSTNMMRPLGFVAGPEGFPRAQWDVVGPHYFATLGITLLSGRDFTNRDDERATPVVAVNEALARMLFPDSNPLGQRLVWGADAQQELEIVAVTRDVRHSGPRNAPQPRFYVPYFQMPVIRPTWTVASTRYLVRTIAAPAALAPVLQDVILSEDPRLANASLDFGDELVGRALVQERMVATLLVAFSLLAAGLAGLGLYGLIAFLVIQRTSEIGVRMALGAQRGEMVWMLLRRAVVWVAIGVVIGTPLAWSAAGVAQNLLFGLSATDALTWLGGTVVISAMGLLAAYIPARRASTVDPLVALRHE